MAVSSIFGGNKQLAKSLVSSRGARGSFTNALASAGSALRGDSSSEASQAANQLSYNQSLGSLQSKLTQWFQAAGVDTSSDIQLLLRSDGSVGLGNNPEDAEKIQDVLTAHPEVANLMQSLAASFKKLNPTAGNSGSGSDDSQFTLTLAAGQATGSLE